MEKELVKKIEILTIPDLHGNPAWKDAIDQEADKIIFLGDYVDSFNYSDKEIESNLRDVIAFKLANPDKVELLIGNHDITYMFGVEYMCSGYRSSQAEVLTEIFTTHKDLFKIAYQYKDGLWTHAGISKRWWDKYGQWLQERLPDSNYGDLLNFAFNFNTFKPCLFEVGPNSGGRLGDESGPLWVRPDEMTETEPFDLNINQIVGHTRFPDITTINKYKKVTYSTCSVTYCDCLDRRSKYLKTSFNDKIKE